MTKYREILRLKSLGFSERNIVDSCAVSRNTIAKVKATEINEGCNHYGKKHISIQIREYLRKHKNMQDRIFLYFNFM